MHLLSYFDTLCNYYKMHIPVRYSIHVTACANIHRQICHCNLNKGMAILPSKTFKLEKQCEHLENVT